MVDHAPGDTDTDMEDTPRDESSHHQLRIYLIPESQHHLMWHGPSTVKHDFSNLNINRTSDSVSTEGTATMLPLVCRR